MTLTRAEALSFIAEDLGALFDGAVDEVEPLGVPEEFRLDPDGERAFEADGQSALPWAWEVRQTGPILGIQPPADDHPITITGVTFIDDRVDPPDVRRLIDWASILSQMGVGLTGRSMPDSAPPPPDADSPHQS